MIQAARVYRTKGKQFERLEEALGYRENLVEEFFRKSPGFYTLPLRERQAFVQRILDRRKELIDLLSYSDDPEEDD